MPVTQIQNCGCHKSVFILLKSHSTNIFRSGCLAYVVHNTFRKPLDGLDYSLETVIKYKHIIFTHLYVFFFKLFIKTKGVVYRYYNIYLTITPIAVPMRHYLCDYVEV